MFVGTIHEDIMGSLILAILEPGQHTPRLKFYVIKLHWFRYWLLPKLIEMVFVLTHLQKADYLTN